MFHPLDNVREAQKRGEAAGIPSICSAHNTVLSTALRGQKPVLIESTCNQVNQFGGYTGMTPAAFVTFVRGLAEKNGFPTENLILGGDHLGPSPWQEMPAERAMQLAAEMVQAYVRAGYTKIHLDTSMKLGDDYALLDQPLDPELVARRTAWLAKAAESACSDIGQQCILRYVIGTEVPIPGGAFAHEDGVQVTSVESAQNTLEIMQTAFAQAGLDSAWERVVALVVQPGVEFGDDFVLDYVPESARELVHFAETMPLFYEAHSTDYQRRENLRALVCDHFAVLKVGPALTYAFREAIFALVMIENELLPAAECSHLVEVLDDAMQRDPSHWQKHYHGTLREQAFARKYSLSDRVRYYWTVPSVQAALGKLLANLGTNPLPFSLISQYLPDLRQDIRARRLPNSARSIVFHRIQAVLDDYLFACQP